MDSDDGDIIPFKVKGKQLTFESGEFSDGRIFTRVADKNQELFLVEKVLK